MHVVWRGGGKPSGRLARCGRVALAGVLLGLGCNRLDSAHWRRVEEPCAGAAEAGADLDWPRLPPEASGLDAGLLDQLTERVGRGDYGNVHAVLIARDGRLAYERYYPGEDWAWGAPLGRVAFRPETLHDLRSVTKSVTSALTGIAIERGLISGTRARLADLFPELSSVMAPGARAVTVVDALTMSTGLEWDESSHPYWDPRNDETRMWLSGDPVRFVLTRPLVAEPGSRFIYHGGTTAVLGAIIQRAATARLDLVAREWLLCPLGVEEAVWMVHRSGLPVAASGLRLRPRDWAKFGQLYADGGRWHGRAILPARWVQESLEPHRDAGDGAAYGYLWWIGRVRTPAGELTVAEARGNGGQRVFVVPETRLVAVIAAGDYDTRDPERRQMPGRLFRDHVLPAAVGRAPGT